MKLVANIKLKPTVAQAAELRRTLERCNAACNWVAAQAWTAKTFRQYDLHKLTYAEVRQRFGLSAQATVRCIAKVADAYEQDRKNPRRFRWDAAQPYDDRIVRFAAHDTLSIWLVSGRARIPHVMGEHQRRLLAHRKGEVDLMVVRGKWYMACVCSFDDPALIDPKGVLGVDMGIVNLATDSTGERFSGAAIDAVRERRSKRRAILQIVGTKAAKRTLKRLSGKQARYQQHVNHGISKAIVSKAERGSLAIAVENLTHIHQRVQANRSQRARLSNWGFGQLRAYIEYKAARAGLPMIAVDPAYSSQTCPQCGNVDRKNRTTQDLFRCVVCGLTGNADDVAARNLASRATVMTPLLALSYVPMAAESRLL